MNGPAPADLAGRMRLRPGAPLPTIDSSRPEAAPRLARGKLAAELPALLGALFTLCSHAHRFTAHRAVSAALGQVQAPADEALVLLQHATAREQAMRIVHDWPQQCPAGEPQPEAWALLRSCPLWRPDLPPAEQLAELDAWLAHKWLGEAPDVWLDRLAQHGPEAALPWAERTAGPVATWLAAVLPRALALRTEARPLALLDEAASTMPLLAQRMQADGFCARPDWGLEVPDTGPWTRQRIVSTAPADNAAMRLLARVADLLQLARPDGRHWLAQGALALGPGEGIAWTEMARGLLVHWVRLEDGPQGPRVADCRVLAPTEWNFHPRGVLARALAALRGTEAEADARLLAIAFDPCVSFVVEPAHA